MLPMRAILHATDFSATSDYAFRLACSLARDYGARLHVMHVAELPAPVVAEGMVMMPPVVDLEPWRQRLQQLQPPLPDICLERHLVEGDPAREILLLAKQMKPDLIVMGTHGRSGVGRLLLGSVAEQVVRLSPYPVLSVKLPEQTRANQPGA